MSSLRLGTPFFCGLSRRCLCPFFFFVVVVVPSFLFSHIWEKKNENGGVLFALSLHLFFYFLLNFLLVSFYHQPAMPLSLPLSLSLSYMRRCYNYLFAKGVVVA